MEENNTVHQILTDAKANYFESFLIAGQNEEEEDCSKQLADCYLSLEEQEEEKKKSFGNYEQNQQLFEAKTVFSTYLYDKLGVPSNASPEDIKIAYRKKSRETHPDLVLTKMSSSETQNVEQIREKFEKQQQDLNNTYGILIDPYKRFAYDLIGIQGVQLWKRMESEKQRKRKRNQRKKLSSEDDDEDIESFAFESSSEEQAARKNLTKFDIFRIQFLQYAYNYCLTQRLHRLRFKTSSNCRLDLQELVSFPKHVNNYEYSCNVHQKGTFRFFNQSTYLFHQSKLDQPGFYPHSNNSFSYTHRLSQEAAISYSLERSTFRFDGFHKNPFFLIQNLKYHAKLSKFLVGDIGWRSLWFPIRISKETWFNPFLFIGSSVSLRHQLSTSSEGFLDVNTDHKGLSSSIRYRKDLRILRSKGNFEVKGITSSSGTQISCALTREKSQSEGVEETGFRSQLSVRTGYNREEQSGFFSSLSFGEIINFVNPLSRLKCLLFGYTDKEYNAIKNKGSGRSNIFGVGYELGTDGSLSMNVDYTFRSQGSDIFHVNIPVSIWNNISFKNALLVAIAPRIFSFCISKFLISPLDRYQKRRMLWKRRVSNFEKTKAQRQKVSQLVNETEMKDLAIESRVDEDERNGLIIMNATYGLGDVERKEEEKLLPEETVFYPPYIDVTIQLQSLVQSSKLELSPNKLDGDITNDGPLKSYSTIRGFYDPCPGEQKYLKVIYTFRGVQHMVEVADNEDLRIPMKEHLTQKFEEQDEYDLTSGSGTTTDI